MQKSDESKEKYHLGYKQLIQSQILRTKVIRIAWQTVTRIPNEIQGVKELKKIEIIPQTNFAHVLTVTRIRANLRDRFFKLTVKKEKEKGNQGDKQVEGKNTCLSKWNIENSMMLSTGTCSF